MTKPAAKSLFLICSLGISVFLIWSAARADDGFYVIAAGKNAKQTILVSPQNTQTASGMNLLKAVNSVVDASESKPYLILIEPGIYDIGNSSINMKSFVYIRGSGRMATRIIGNVSGSTGVIYFGAGQDNTWLSESNIENKGGGDHAIAIYVKSSSPSIRHVLAMSSGGTNSNIGVYNDSSSPNMVDMRCVASGPASANLGIYNSDSSPEIYEVSAEATGATHNIAVDNESSTPSMRYMTTTAKGGDLAVGVYNVSSTSEMVHVRVQVSQAKENAGIRNFNSSSVNISSLGVTVEGGEKTYGVQTTESSTATLRNVTIEAKEGSIRNYAVFVNSSNCVLDAATIASSSTGGAETYGVECQNTSTVRIGHCTIYAASNTIRGVDGSDVKVGNTLFSGGPAVGVDAW